MNNREIQALKRRLVSAGILSVRTYNSGGKGGQHSNRTNNAVELTGKWNLNGEELIIRSNASMKSQSDSMKSAMIVLISKLNAEIRKVKSQKERKMESGFSGKYVRTYHEPDNRVVCHASGRKFSYSEIVDKNNIGLAIDARRSEMEAMKCRQEHILR